MQIVNFVRRERKASKIGRGDETALDPTLDTTPAYTMTRYQYTGQFSYESEFGLYFFKARFYDSSLGRFTSPDITIPNASNSKAWDRYSYVFNNPLKFTDPSGYLPQEEWIRLYGENKWKTIKEQLSKEIIDFLLSDAFVYGNIAVLQFGDGGPILNFFIGIGYQNQGIALYNLENKKVYSGDFVFWLLQKATRWGAMQRKQDPNKPGDYFAGGYETISSNLCGTCDESIVDPGKMPKDWWKNPTASNFVPGENGYIYVKSTINPLTSIRATLEYYIGLGTIGAGCTSLGPCIGALWAGGNLLADSWEHFDDSIVDQRPVIVDLTPR